MFVGIILRITEREKKQEIKSMNKVLELVELLSHLTNKESRVL